MNYPLVSVIIPNYNHARFLKYRIESVLNQTYSNFEIIILDDFSTDESEQIIKQFENHPKVSKTIFNDQNSGNTFKQWKKGLNLARGQFVWVAESDDFADSELIAALMKSFQDSPEVILSYCQSALVDEDGHYIRTLDWADALNPKRWKNDYISDSRNEVNEYLSFRNTIPNASAVIFRKPKDLQMLNESLEYRIAGDWVFWRNLLSQPGKISFTARTLNYFRLHGATTRAATSAVKEKERIRELNRLMVRSKLSIFSNKYDWMLIIWVQHRRILKGDIQFYIPDFPPLLLFRLVWLIINSFFNKIRMLKN